MPPKNTFSGTTTTGVSESNRAKINALGAWDDGWHFYTKDATSPSTIYYPAIGSRTFSGGNLYGVKSRGYYWTGIPASEGAGCCLDIRDYPVTPICKHDSQSCRFYSPCGRLNNDFKIKLNKSRNN